MEKFFLEMAKAIKNGEIAYPPELQKFVVQQIRRQHLYDEEELAPFYLPNAGDVVLAYISVSGKMLRTPQAQMMLFDLPNVYTVLDVLYEKEITFHYDVIKMLVEDLNKTEYLYALIEHKCLCDCGDVCNLAILKAIKARTDGAEIFKWLFKYSPALPILRALFIVDNGVACFSLNDQLELIKLNIETSCWYMCRREVELLFTHYPALISRYVIRHRLRDELEAKFFSLVDFDSEQKDYILRYGTLEKAAKRELLRKPNAIEWVKFYANTVSFSEACAMWLTYKKGKL